MLKISIVGDSDQTVEFHLEGKLVGPWVDEVRRLGEQALLHNKLVTLDLKDVRFVDCARRLLYFAIFRVGKFLS